jgi:Ricin-type beta-trefoil lectin domain/Glycosyl hydrolase family 12
VPLISLVAVAVLAVMPGDAAPRAPSLGRTARMAAPPVTTGTYCTSSTGRYTYIPVDRGGYALSPDEWNSSANMCISTDGGAHFTVSSSDIPDPGTGAPGAYPNLTYIPADGDLPTPVASLGDTLTSWSTKLSAASGKYDVSYDIWYADSTAGCQVPGSTPAHEMMIWINEGGGAVPYPAPAAASPRVTLQNETYQVTYIGDSPGHSVINYFGTTPVTSVYALDLRQFTADAASRGDDQFGKPYLPASGYLCSVSAGFEIFSGNGGEQTTSFSYQPPPRATPPSGVITSAVPGLCLNAGGSKPDQSVATQQVYALQCATAASAPAAGQDWTVYADGTLQMFGRCLGETSAASGSSVLLRACSGSSGEKWLINGRTLRNLGSGLCLTDPATPGQATLDVGACGTAAGQQWREPYGGAGIWTSFSSQTAGDCLKAAGNGTAERGRCDPARDSTERWEAEPDGTIVSSAGKCLDAAAGKLSRRGTRGRVTVRLCSGASSQQWVITPAGGLMSPAAGLCLDDPHSSAVAGTRLDATPCNGTAAQQWTSAATSV